MQEIGLCQRILITIVEGSGAFAEILWKTFWLCHVYIDVGEFNNLLDIEGNAGRHC